ncbi:(2Fe-2S)-binding protein [Devosia sp. XJ19-1]|uniref:(2Fe-2S)-binding protein n=1 Tax=Devosia ureilytica TaxID=2952754 RepID=A0A9Q4AMN9_9HYPH|nr:2Fe-2S iron-sulfur cluster-binding protein [Devosia ureilytica]MCP8883211.1 (2Fe-2S)-binding protein [Devosia ureilytica]MCP8886421.1 (2Fe-2S)-binding protein [Devosia ureilytica]
MTRFHQTFSFDGTPVACTDNETIASALDRAGIRVLGPGQNDCAGRYFCGIGACQACVVSVDGTRMEACLTPARAGLFVQRIGSGAS